MIYYATGNTIRELERNLRGVVSQKQARHWAWAVKQVAPEARVAVVSRRRPRRV